MVEKVKVAIIGASGYTGGDLLRLFYFHGGVEVTAVTSRRYKGRRVDEVFPSLKGFYPQLSFKTISEVRDEADFYFLALPHGVSMLHARKFLQYGKVIDLGADFRIKSLRSYEQWYGEHQDPELVEIAVYGIPELFRNKITSAKLVANPGCYPTSVILGAYPLVKSGMVEEPLIVDSKSGVTGAGRKPSERLHFPEVNENFYPYRINGHRHMAEMEEQLGVRVIFTPHLLPVDRGILSTIYVRTNKNITVNNVMEIYSEFYGNEPFVRLLGNSAPAIKDVRGTNYVDIGWAVDNGLIRIFVAIDNLVKGASGQAVQNFNLIAGFEEIRGLISPPLFP